HVREPDGLAVPLGRDRAEERAVGGVDERVLADRDRPQRGQVAVRGDRCHTAEAADREQERQAEREADEGEDEPAAARPHALAAALAAADPDRQVGVAPGVARAPPADGRAHANTPAARRRSCARRRRSLATRSALATSGVQVRSVTVAWASIPVTSTSPSGGAASRKTSTTRPRSWSSGTWKEASASACRARIVAFRIVSEASFSFGITSRVSSSARLNV